MKPEMGKIERRFVVASLERRDAGADSPGLLVGHATTWRSRYDIGNPKRWGWSESFMPGAFSDVIARKDDVVALWNHDESEVLGRTTSGTLQLEDDGLGLLSKIALPQTSRGRDLAVLVGRRDVHQMSLAFAVKEETWRTLADGTEERDIIKADLFDVSPVTFPANQTTDVALRGATSALLEARRIAALDLEYRRRRLRLL